MATNNAIQTEPQGIGRRRFVTHLSTGIGSAALASLADPILFAQDGVLGKAAPNQLPGIAPKAKRVIYLFQSGGPAQMDLFDYKPRLKELQGTNLPDSVRKGQRLTGMTAGQKTFPVASSAFKFARHGESGAWVSEAMPHLSKVVDDVCFVKSIYTEAINHDPAITFFQTGSQFPGRPCMGSWISYGLGSENRNLPTFVVFTSIGTGRPGGQPLYARLWGSGFLPSNFQGVKLRATGDPILYLSDPPGLSKDGRRGIIDAVTRLNRARYDEVKDPEIATRIQQYELAFRMQSSVPDLVDVTGESEQTFKMYGPDARKPGTYAANCLLARRLVERGVRFIQLYHRGWDQHGTLPKALRGQCHDTDQPTAALITDLKQRGLLDETLVIWGGEFGRTVYSQGALTKDNYGRDHHPRCFTVFLAGGGIRGGISYGVTDDFCYNIVENPVHVHDLQATVLHCLGIDHKRLTHRFQGRDYRLTDIGGNVVSEILS